MPTKIARQQFAGSRGEAFIKERANAMGFLFNNYGQPEAALDGLGIALMPSALVVDELAAGRLTIAWNVPGVYERDYFHLLSPFSRQTEIARSFCAWLSKEGEESNRLGDIVIKAGAPNRGRASQDFESKI